jgi:hypothetical protein
MPHKGYKMTEEHRLKISKSLIGNKRAVGNHANKPVRTEEHKRKLGSLLNEYKNTEKYKQAVANRINPGNTGKKHSEAAKDKVRQAKLGNKYWVGKHHKEETKDKLRLINLKENLSEETLRRRALSVPKGEQHYNFNNWSSREQYAKEDKAIRRIIRNRDNHTCQECGIKENGRLHAVHHIDYNKKNNNQNNLITLCIKCHTKTNRVSEKNYWIAYYKSKMFDIGRREDII